MLEQLKPILITKYNKKIEEYDIIKREIDEVEKTMSNDNSEEEYKNNLKNLKNKKLKKKSVEYIEELEKINSLYNQGLIDFKTLFDKYTDLKQQALKLDVYGYKRKITRVENSKELSDLQIDEEKAEKIINGSLEDF